jgi:hypothetical protein
MEDYIKLSTYIIVEKSQKEFLEDFFISYFSKNISEDIKYGNDYFPYCYYKFPNYSENKEVLNILYDILVVRYDYKSSGIIRYSSSEFYMIYPIFYSPSFEVYIQHEMTIEEIFEKHSKKGGNTIWQKIKTVFI